MLIQPKCDMSDICIPFVDHCGVFQYTYLGHITNKRTHIRGILLIALWSFKFVHHRVDRFGDERYPEDFRIKSHKDVTPICHEGGLKVDHRKTQIRENITVHLELFMCVCTGLPIFC